MFSSSISSINSARLVAITSSSVNRYVMHKTWVSVTERNRYFLVISNSDRHWLAIKLITFKSREIGYSYCQILCIHCSLLLSITTYYVDGSSLVVRHNMSTIYLHTFYNLHRQSKTNLGRCPYPCAKHRHDSGIFCVAPDDSPRFAQAH